MVCLDADVTKLCTSLFDNMRMVQFRSMFLLYYSILMLLSSFLLRSTVRSVLKFAALFGFSGSTILQMALCMTTSDSSYFFLQFSKNVGPTLRT